MSTIQLYLDPQRQKYVMDNIKKNLTCKQDVIINCLDRCAKADEKRKQKVEQETKNKTGSENNNEIKNNENDLVLGKNDLNVGGVDLK